MRRNPISQRVLEPVLWFAGLLLVWEVLVRVLQVPVYVLPAPSQFLSRIVEDYQRLGYHALVTTRLIVYGFVAGAIPGVVLGYLIAKFRLAEQVLYPLVVFIQGLPKITLTHVLSENIKGDRVLVDRDFEAQYPVIGAHPVEAMLLIRLTMLSAMGNVDDVKEVLAIPRKFDVYTLLGWLVPRYFNDPGIKAMFSGSTMEHSSQNVLSILSLADTRAGLSPILSLGRARALSPRSAAASGPRTRTS